MSEKQRTLKGIVKVNGIGLHTGLEVNLEIHPAPDNHGYKFQRIDLEGKPTIKADVDLVVSTERGTNLEQNNAKVHTTEHVLAALYGCQVDNALITVDGPEIPIMDGSSGPFVFLLQSAGIQDQGSNRDYLLVKEEITVQDDTKKIVLQPYDGFQVNFLIDYQHPTLQKDLKSASLDFSTSSYVTSISRARTFGFLAEYEHLRASNKALGGSLKNAIVLDKFSIMNEGGFRYRDELVKHKILDAIGDLYLLGHGVIGCFSGYRSGHSLNNLLLNTLLERKDAWELVNLDEHSSLSKLQYA